METRLIVAYTLIAIIVGIIVVGGVILSRRQAKSRRRDAGKGNY